MLEEKDQSEIKLEFDNEDPSDNTYKSIDPESDFFVDSIDHCPSKIQYGIYRKIREYVSFINLKKEKIKTEAENWLVIMVFAPFYLFFVGEPGLPVSKSIVLFYVETMIIVYTTLLWYKDCILSHEDLKILYVTAVLMEKKDKSLGESFQNMGKVLHGKILDPNLLDTIRYIAIMSPCFLLGTFGLAIFSHGSKMYIFAYSISFIIWIASMAVWSVFLGGSKAKEEYRTKKGDLQSIIKNSKTQ